MFLRYSHIPYFQPEYKFTFSFLTIENSDLCHSFFFHFCFLNVYNEYSYSISKATICDSNKLLEENGEKMFVGCQA